MQPSNRPRWSAISAGVAFASLVGSVLLAAATPVSAATPTTGAWIFPHAKRTDAVADALDDSFYVADSQNPWLQDSYFADSSADGATVAVDLYNPTGSALYNVQVFAAYNIENLALVSSIAFSGGSSGDLSYSGSDLESGGTPQMAGGVSIDGHEVYPAYFVSYGVGDLPAGTSGILSFTIDIVGEFGNGLIVHLDYTAEDADGNGVSGPFEADMNIFENGDSTPACEPGAVVLTGSVSGGTYSPGSGEDFAVTAGVSVNSSEITDVRATMFDSAPATVKSASAGTVANGGWSWDVPLGSVPLSASATVKVSMGPSALPGDAVPMAVGVSWTDCDGDHSTSLTLTLSVTNSPSGGARDAGWWADQVGKCEKGKKLAVGLGKDMLLGMFQGIAAHSDIFTIESWNGTSPGGSSDAGSVDIHACADAAKVFDKKTGESKKVRGSEREDLALWLNIAAGSVNLDTALKVVAKNGKVKGSEFADHTGLNSLPSAYDTPGEILAFLEKQVKDWQDGQGASKSDLKLARRLARSVNNEWLVAA